MIVDEHLLRDEHPIGVVMMEAVSRFRQSWRNRGSDVVITNIRISFRVHLSPRDKCVWHILKDCKWVDALATSATSPIFDP